MIEYNVRRAMLALGLDRKIIGIKFLYTKEQYDESNYPIYKYKTKLCYMVKKAMEGEIFKCNKEHFGCRCAIEAIGIDREMDCVVSGERYFACQLYKSRAIAKSTQRDVLRIQHNIYGIIVGPLDQIDNADVIIMMADAYQTMRIVQGYVYKYGAVKNICMAGNQGVCSDLVARPYEKNDMNISILCAGARRACGWNKSEIGIGIPINLFNDLVEGIIQTLNLIEYENGKKEILDRLEVDGLEASKALGIKINFDIHYGKMAIKYIREPTIINQDGDINVKNI